MPISKTFAERLMPRLPDLLNQFPTPFHVYDGEGIVASHRRLTAAFEGIRFQQHFAVKALPNPTILDMLLAEGSGLDCASPIELRLARDCQAAGDKVVYTANNTTPAEISDAIDQGALVTFDDLTALTGAPKLPSVVSFRVTPSIESGASNLMGQSNSAKFGVPCAEAVLAYQVAKDLGANRFGIHAMTCANELSAINLVNAAQDLANLAVHIEHTVGIEFEYINFGGGLGIPYQLSDADFDLRQFASGLRAVIDERFRKRDIMVRTEIGRYITGPHGVLISRVINRMHKGREIIGLDASMSSLMRPALYGAYHHITFPPIEDQLSDSDEKLDAEIRADVVGSLCENMDKFAIERTLPDVSPGAVALIHDTGAHGHSMGFNYNGRLRPAEVLLTAGGDFQLIRRAETFDDYAATVVRIDKRLHATTRNAAAL
ncbi:diaminopimelate decarboxylase [Mycobacterium gordonae]|uniref:diaminopimelate decarboxylase n=1 Tax=Mycobacterium gordonae TaxID=1778 RepID=UPI0007C7D7AE|nr:diaminopimelate decarboxylase [Mycobacterium gordonae]